MGLPVLPIVTRIGVIFYEPFSFFCTQRELPLSCSPAIPDLKFWHRKCTKNQQSWHKSKNTLTKWIPKTLFLKDRPFTSRGFFYPKSVFLTSFLVSDVGMFLQNWLIHWFQLITDALTVPPKNCVTGAAAQWQNGQKSLGAVVGHRRTDARFKASPTQNALRAKIRKFWDVFNGKSIKDEK